MMISRWFGLLYEGLNWLVQVGFYLLSIPLIDFWLATLVCNYALVFWCMYLLFAGLDYLYSPHHIVEHE